MEASHAVARVNSIRPELCYFVQQNPDVIDEGVFHNDVISVGHKNVFLYHEKSFLDTDRVIDEIDQRLDHTLIGIKVTSKEVSVEQAVQTYLFNSQIISLSDREMALVAPQHCKEEPSVKAFIDKMLKSPDNPINKVFYFDLLQSMKNGGGPACLRLRVQLTKEELLNVNKECLLTDQKYNQLVQWVEKNYRDTLTTKDLFDPQFIGEVKRALEDLTVILKLPGIYNF
jgi:succinylarginine dihydrolase